MMKKVKIIPTPPKNETVLKLARNVSQALITLAKLTNRVGCSINVEQIVEHTGGQVRPAERVERRVVELGHIADDHRRREEPQVLKAVLLGALGADDRLFGRWAVSGESRVSEGRT